MQCQNETVAHWLWLFSLESSFFLPNITSRKLQLIVVTDGYAKSQISHLENRRNFTDECFVEVRLHNSFINITCSLFSVTLQLYIKSNYSLNSLVYTWTCLYFAWSENWQLVLSATCYQHSSIFGQLHINLKYTDTGNEELFKLCGNADSIINLWFNAVQSMSYLWLRIVIYFSISNQRDSSTCASVSAFPFLTITFTSTTKWIWNCCYQFIFMCGPRQQDQRKTAFHLRKKTKASIAFWYTEATLCGQTGVLSLDFSYIDVSMN